MELAHKKFRLFGRDCWITMETLYTIGIYLGYSGEATEGEHQLLLGLPALVIVVGIKAKPKKNTIKK